MFDDDILDDFDAPGQNPTTATTVFAIVFVIGWIFYVQHWPGAFILMTAAYSSYLGVSISALIKSKSPFNWFNGIVAISWTVLCVIGLFLDWGGPFELDNQSISWLFSGVAFAINIFYKRKSKD